MDKRRKLFSSTPETPVRRKLFSSNQSGVSVPQIKKVVCQDCGYVMDTLEVTSTLYCPKCGGKRFNVISSAVAPEGQKTFSNKRISLFGDLEQKEFSEATTPIEEKLKLYSGKTLDNREVSRLFSGTGYTKDDLVEKGFAEVIDDNRIKLYDTAFLQSKLFSKLIISVTKELDLDPIECPKEDFIDSLKDRGTLSPKGILIIKKAHAIPSIMKESNFSEDIMDEWAVDSGILNDIRLEFGGQNMSIPEVKDILCQRYNDSPEDVFDYLIKKGILIPRDGDRIDIRK